LIRAEQLGAERWFVFGKRLCREPYANAGPQTQHGLANGFDAQLHLLAPLDLFDRILSSQFSRARFGLSFGVPFVDTLNIAFVGTIFVGQHYR
jgi:hypothetical protein